MSVFKVKTCEETKKTSRVLLKTLKLLKKQPVRLKIHWNKSSNKVNKLIKKTKKQKLLMKNNEIETCNWLFSGS